MPGCLPSTSLANGLITIQGQYVISNQRSTRLFAFFRANQRWISSGISMKEIKRTHTGYKSCTSPHWAVSKQMGRRGSAWSATMADSSSAGTLNAKGSESNILDMLEAAESAPVTGVSMRKDEPIPDDQLRAVDLTVHGVTNLGDALRLETQIMKLDGVQGVWLGPHTEGGLRQGSIALQMQVQKTVSLRSLVEKVHALEASLLALPFQTQRWTWRGHNINYAVAGCGKPLILVHGFGGNVGHFRNLISHLADDHQVYALDLLGFGASDMPADVNYGPELWAELVNDFAAEFAGQPAVLVGNSIGSLTALTAAACAKPNLYRGLILLNCAGAMNRKGLAQDDALLAAMTPIFLVVEFFLQKPRVANVLFEKFKSKDYVRKILQQQVYRDKTAVTDQLVDILCEPANQLGAIDVFVKVFLGDPGPRPEALMKTINLPLLVLWGEKDPWTPVKGKLAKFFKELEKSRDNVTMKSLEDVGHCPHDDRPELAASLILPWLKLLDA